MGGLRGHRAEDTILNQNIAPLATEKIKPLIIGIVAFAGSLTKKGPFQKALFIRSFSLAIKNAR
jgi:hypothetical protein